MAVYACSDLHGMKNLYDKICNFLNPDDTVYFLGDATDRGPQSWETFKAIAANPQFIFIKGNHEDMLHKAMIEQYSDFGDDYWGGAYSLLCYNEGYETFESWLAEGADRKWIAYIRDLPTYKTYINKQGQTIHLSHAGFNYKEGEPIPPPKGLMWNRNHIRINPDKMFPPVSNEKNIIVHGHTPIPTITHCENLIGILTYADGTKINIDTGAYYTKYITLLDLDTFSEYQFWDEEK